MTCPACNAAIPETSKFCPECGTVLAKHPGSAPVQAEELRQVTVIFSDLSGYTAMSERLPAEEVKEITSRIFREAAAIAKKYDGRLDRLVGDCALILFGLPRLHEDDAIRALLTAMEINRSVSPLNTPELVARIGRPLSMHTGVNTGAVVTGRTDFEAGTETVVGDPVNLASRLKDAAQPGQILVGPSTWRYTSDAFEYRALGTISLKGKEKPISVYELLCRRVKEGRSDYETLDRSIHSELVARKKELELLERQALRLIDGEGSIIFVKGEAGVGKSRLLAELRGKDCLKGATLLEGSAQSIGRNLSFHPFLEMLDGWAGIREEDGASEISTKLEAAIERAASGEAGEIFPFVAVMRGLELRGRHANRVSGIAGDALAKLVFKSLRDLIRLMSRQRPIVIILEDLHWVDQSSLELLEALFKLAESERVMFLAALRPSEQKTEKLVENVRQAYGPRCLVIDLAALNRPETEQMVSNLLKNRAIPRDILDSIGERAGGNPFFIEEIVRSWIDQGAVAVSKDGFQITDRIEHSLIPYTVNQAIMARIDRLEEDTREVLRVASVIGRSFFYRILAQLAENVGTLGARLEQLKTIQLILERHRMEEVEYLFKHALVQQAIYDSLLLQVRKRIHAGVARSIESLFAERLPEFLGVLAFHYIQAEDFDKAEEYLLKAGDAMLVSSASSEAIYYFQEGLAIYLQKVREKADPLKLARLEKNIAYAHYHRGQYLEAVEHFEKALFYLGVRPAKGIPLMLTAAAGFLRMLAFLYLPRRKNLPQPNSREREIIDILIRKAVSWNEIEQSKFVMGFLSAYRYAARFNFDEVYPLAVVLAAVATVVSIIGLLKLSRYMLERAEQVIREHSYLTETMYVEADAQISCFDGTWNSPHLLHFREPGSFKGEFQAVTMYLAFCGIINLEQGDFSRAMERIGQLQHVAEVFENLDARVCYQELKAKYLIKTGKAAEAVPEVEKGFAASREAGQRPMCIYFLGMKAMALSMLGNLEEGVKVLQEAEGFIKKEGMVFAHFKTRYAIARFNLEILRLETDCARKQVRKAARAARTALACSRKWIGDRTEALRLMGTFNWLKGKKQKALHSWHESIQVGERIGAKLELARTWMEIGKRLLENESGSQSLDGISAEEYLSRAGAFFREKELARDLEILEKATS
jgi:class 3 adenylate cyclase/tetratricopeptide (TPR) repeat protein